MKHGGGHNTIQDHNTIESMWHGLKIAVHQHKPSVLKNLEYFYLEEFFTFPVAKCAKLIKAYPK